MKVVQPQSFKRGNSVLYFRFRDWWAIEAGGGGVESVRRNVSFLVTYPLKPDLLGDPRLLSMISLTQF